MSWSEALYSGVNTSSTACNVPSFASGRSFGVLSPQSHPRGSLSTTFSFFMSSVVRSTANLATLTTFANARKFSSPANGSTNVPAYIASQQSSVRKT